MPLRPVDAEAWPCGYDFPAARTATSEVAALSARVDSLAPDGDSAPLLAELKRLLEGPCFALARLEGRDFDIVSSLSLRSFWKSGGRAWVEGFIDIDDAPPAGRTTWVPPTPRKALTLRRLPGIRWRHGSFARSGTARAVPKPSRGPRGRTRTSASSTACGGPLSIRPHRTRARRARRALSRPRACSATSRGSRASRRRRRGRPHFPSAASARPAKVGSSSGGVGDTGFCDEVRRTI